MAGKRSKSKKGGNKKGRSRARRAKQSSNGGWASGGVRATGPAGIQRAAPRHNHAGLCMALCDPFADSCRGMKYPDGLNGRSLPLQIKYANHAAVDSNGFFAVHVTPKLPYGNLVTTSIGTTGLATWNTVWSSHVMPGIFSSYAKTYRVVCWGVRIVCESPVTDTGGTLMVTTLQEPCLLSVVGTPSTYQIGEYMGVETVSYPLSTGKTIIWVGKPQGPRLFIPVNDNSNVDMDSPFTTLVISIAGGVASKTRIAYEVVMNVEMTLTQGGMAQGLGHLSGQDPVPSPAGLAVANHVANRMPSAHEGSDSLRSQLMAEVRNALGNVGRAAVSRASGAAIAAIGGGM